MLQNLTFYIICHYSLLVFGYWILRFHLFFIFHYSFFYGIPARKLAVGLRLQVRVPKPCDCMVVKGAPKVALLLPASQRLTHLRAFSAPP